MRKWLVLAAIAVLPVAFLASQTKLEAQELFKEGKDYAVISSPVKTGNPNKVELTEVFWYGCGHCNNFRPLFEEWKKKQPEDVLIRRSPAIWNKNMETHARIFYTATALGKQNVMHKDVFDAMHIQKQKLLKTKEIYPLFAKHDVTKEVFEKTFNSFGVNSMVKQADARARAYGITGTPELVVNGKYRISAGMVGGQAQMLEVADYLIKKEKALIAN